MAGCGGEEKAVAQRRAWLGLAVVVASRAVPEPGEAGDGGWGGDASAARPSPSHMRGIDPLLKYENMNSKKRSAADRAAGDFIPIKI